MNSLQLSKTLGAEQEGLYEPVPADPAVPAKAAAPAPVKGDLLDDSKTKAFSASPEGRKLAAWIDSSYRDAKNKRRQYERQWYMNLAFYSGKQYVEWSKHDDKLMSTPVRSQWTPRLVVNKIQPIIRTEQSKMTGQKPSASVMPASNDDADIFAATAGEQVWESLYDRLNFQNKLSRSTFWLSICGTSFMKAYWDTTAYDVTSKLYGDIQWLAMSPFHILVPDLLEPDLESQGWVIDVQTKPIEWVEAVYGDYFPKGVKPTISRTNEILDAAGVGATTDSKPDSATIIEMWIKPNHTKLLPEGGMITLIDSTIVQAAIHGMPYEHGEFPFAKFEHIPSGKFYCTSTIEPLIPLQREYNRTQSQIVEAKNRMAKPQMLFREGSVDPTKVTSEPGVWIPIKGTSEFPQPVPLTELPSYVVQFNERQETDFENISGQHAPTRGDAPAGMAATAIAYLQEQDDSYLATTQQSIEQGIQKIAKQSLVLAVTYWDVPRLIKATGEDGGPDAIELKGSDIAGSTDLRIERGSALSTSKAARQAQVTEWMKFGWIDPNDGFELLDMPMLQQWVNRRKVDKKAAQIENIAFRDLDPERVIRFQQAEVGEAKQALQEQFAQRQQQIQRDPSQALGGSGIMSPELAPTGIAPDPQGQIQSQSPVQINCIIPVNTWDDHDVHMQIHDLWRKSPSYRFVSDAVKMEVEKHQNLHKQARTQKLMEDMALAGMDPAASGGPDQSGGAPRSPLSGNLDAAVDPAQTSPFQGSTEEQLAPPA